MYPILSGNIHMGINSFSNGLQSWSVLVFLDPETGFITAEFIKR